MARNNTLSSLGFLIRFDYYQSVVEEWEKIFKRIKLSKKDVVIDICSGWAPKIELALLRSHFAGTITIVDKSRWNTTLLCELLTPFKKKFNLNITNVNILTNDFPSNLKGNIIIGNHILDDLLIDQYFSVTKKGIDMYKDISMYKKIWIEIEKNDSIFSEVLSQLTQNILKLSQSQVSIILTQYPGYQEKLYGVKDVYRKSHKLLLELQNILQKKHGFKNDSEKFASIFADQSTCFFSKKDYICLTIK